MERNFELIAKTIVDQHYASGPDELKEKVREALMAAAGVSPNAGFREALEKDVREREKASGRGSE